MNSSWHQVKRQYRWSYNSIWVANENISSVDIPGECWSISKNVLWSKIHSKFRQVILRWVKPKWISVSHMSHLNVFVCGIFINRTKIEHQSMTFTMYCEYIVPILDSLLSKINLKAGKLFSMFVLLHVCTVQRFWQYKLALFFSPNKYMWVYSSSKTSNRIWKQTKRHVLFASIRFMFYVCSAWIRDIYSTNIRVEFR